VAEKGKRAAQEQREHPCPQQLLLGDLAVGVQEGPAALRRQRRPEKREVDRRVVAREVDPVDHRGRLPIVSDQEMPKVQVAVADVDGLGRRDALRLDEELLDERRRVPDAFSLERVQPVARPLNAEWHVGAPHGVERKVGVELETVERPKELGEREGKPRTRFVIQIGVRKLSAGEIRGSVKRPLELI
jgi:hypothetical protein